MMARNLNLLSDSDDSDIDNTSLEQEQGPDCDQGSDHDYDEANMTMVDRTCIFMSNLEHDYDQQEAVGQGIPSLLSETLPVNDYDISFMSDSDMPNRNSPIAPRSSLLPPQRNRTSQWLQTQPLPPMLPPFGTTGTTGKEREFLKSRSPLPLSPESRRPFQAPPLAPAKEIIVEEFLRSLPPLPQSPECKTPLQPLSLERLPAKESVLDSFPPLPYSPDTLRSFPRDSMLGAMDEPSRTVQIGSGRTYPILTPIVTSKEHCQQILQRRNKNSDHRRHMTPPSATRSQSPLSLASPVTVSPYSDFSTPMPCDDLPSGLSTPSSAYHSAREEFSQPSTHSQQESPNMTGLKMSPSQGGSSMNISSELIQPPPAPIQETRRARIEATEAILTGSPRARYQPLDMIIIRPATANTGHLPKNSSLRPGSGGSSPWSPLSPTQSIDSRHSEGIGGSSSWSWSLPSSLQSTAGSLGSTSVDGLLVDTAVEGRDAIVRRRPNPSASTTGIKVKSRSMSSLTKQQHGWLSFQALDVRMVASGRCHIVVVTRTNQVYSCWEPNNDESTDSGSTLTQETSGRDVEFALGRSVNTDNGAGYVQDTALHPVLVGFGGLDALESPIVKVVCSDNATFLLTEAGDLWGWGYFEDMNGTKIGLIHKDSASRPIQISSHGQRIKDVVCGNNHVLILSAASDVISWGSNEYGQLARQRMPSHSPLVSINAAFDLSPHFIENLPINILGIGASKTGSFAWDENQLYAWGDNTFGQLGYESNTNSASRWRQSISGTSSHDNRDFVIVPRKVALHWKGRSIKRVLGGLRHTVILSNSGLIITLGDDEFGQLGATPQSTQASSALASRSASPFNSSCSRLTQSPFSSPGSSSLVNFDSHPSSSSISSDVSGEGISPSTSPRLRSRRLNPTLVRVGSRVKEISCGDFHTATCCENGQMYAWGQGFEGILAIHNAYSGTQQSPRTSFTDSSSSSSLRGNARKVVAVSTMRHGVSVALVSSA
ncbi:Radial spoke head 14 [Linnemannia exigua]|uniref:Radial spoke head 14 n=1 Tax=Linnemannia exigua TaxID=604196 RepID=A0AAD4DDT6_9FUNG|nr:Radial spoke head 14 [Linnemannia exigua]